MVQVFLSWSGERSKAVARALRDWLPMVVQSAQPWMSDADISAGDRWASEIGQQLEACQYGIICITPENLTAPWLNFEAGALSKQFGKAGVCPYLLGLDWADLKGPLAQFQGKKAERQQTLEMVLALNARVSKPLEGGRLARVFDALWPQLEADLAKVPSRSAVTRAALEAAQRQIVKEMQTVCQALRSGPASPVELVERVHEVSGNRGVVRNVTHLRRILNSLPYQGLVERADGETYQLTAAGVELADNGDPY